MCLLTSASSPAWVGGAAGAMAAARIVGAGAVAMRSRTSRRGEAADLGAAVRRWRSRGTAREQAEDLLDEAAEVSACCAVRTDRRRPRQGSRGVRLRARRGSAGSRQRSRCRCVLTGPTTSAACRQRACWPSPRSIRLCRSRRRRAGRSSSPAATAPGERRHAVELTRYASAAFGSTGAGGGSSRTAGQRGGDDPAGAGVVDQGALAGAEVGAAQPFGPAGRGARTGRRRPGPGLRRTVARTWLVSRSSARAHRATAAVSTWIRSR
jgi:hypothetical protein